MFRLFASMGLVLTACFPTAGAPPGPAQRTFQFEYAATVRGLPAGRPVDVWLPLPTTDPNQTIRSLRIDAPGPVEITREPEWGNQVLHLRVPAPATGSLPVRLEVVATRRESAGEAERLSAADRRRYLAPDRLVPTGGRIGELARTITRGKQTEMARARAIYDHVTATMRYDKSGTGWGRGDALYACDARRGNCTDFHSLIIGLARAAGIPARFQIGFPLPEARGAGEIPGYHCWAELYVDGRWLPVDSSEAAKNPAKRAYFFGHHDENRIQFSAGRDLVPLPPPKEGPLNYLVYPVVEVDGKPHAEVERAFRFKDLPPVAAASRGRGSVRGSRSAGPRRAPSGGRG